LLVGLAMDARAMIGGTAFLLVGFAAGTVNFALLRWNTVLYAEARRSRVAIAMHVSRLGTLAVLLTLIALHGALPLLLTALGLLIARPLVIRWATSP
jgi:hypothetical protein